MPHECTNCGRVFADGSKEMLSGCPNCGGNKFQFRPSSATSTDSDTPAGEPASTETSGESAETSGRDGNRAPKSDRTTEERNPQSTTSTAWSGTAERAIDERADERTNPSRPEEKDTSRQWVNQRRDDPAADERDDGSDGIDDGPEGPSSVETEETFEDTAQASARSDVVSPDELAAASAGKSVDDSADGGQGFDDGPASGSDENPPTADDAAPANRDGPPTDADGRVIEPSSEDRPGLDDLREELNEQFESIRIVAPGEYELNLMELYDRTEYIISLQEDGRYVIEVPDTWDTTPDESDRA